MKNAFHLFHLNPSFHFKVFKFCPDFFGHEGKRLDMKVKVSFKLMTSETRKQIITIHMLPKISRSIANLTMKFDQLIEFNVRNIFIEKSSKK